MNKRPRSIYHKLLAATLFISGTLPLASPVFAEGTAAGTAISNTANATYENPNAPGTTINTTSNTVNVTVAEVAGITISSSGVTNVSGGSVKVGDQLNYTYTVTNVGNDPTRFRIPNLAAVTGPATVSGSLSISTDGGKTWTPITGTEVITNSVPAGGSILVQVPITVAAGAKANDVISVKLGDTPGDAQNQLRNPNGGDVYTVDNPDGTAGETTGAPVNGVREASVTQQATVASTLANTALTTLLLTRTNYDNAGTPNVITDDKVSYALSLRVENTDPTGNGLTPAPLVGAPITLNGTPNTPRILISDAIPTGTQLATIPTPPPGWRAVYTTDPVSTNANSASWKTFPLQGADTLAGITRVGFVNDPTVITSVAPGTTVTGFSIQLGVKSTATSPLTIANIAQAFGQTSGTTTLVFDESGDQNPNNYNGSNPSVNPIGSGLINNPANPETGVDSGNNNTGTGTEGEANVFTISVAVPSSIQNGPINAPDAIGPTSNNDDFTNASSLIPPNQAPGSTLDPAPVAFTNTVKNNGTSPGSVTLAPTTPPIATDVPDNTTVTITYGSDSVAYSYNKTTGFTITSSTVGSNKPITLPLAANQSVNYGVEVNLPTGTPLSTDVNRGFPVPIVAAIDTNNDSTPDAQNMTIDRVYTGYLKMLKESRVLQGTGSAVQGSDGTFSSTPKFPAPGNIIEYRITYSNISDPQTGTGNIILNANKVVITEDGTLSTTAGDGKNNWALDNDGNGVIDTSNITGSAIDSGASTITFFSGQPASNLGSDQTGTTVNTDVTKYVDTVTGIVAPGSPRTFTFQRKVN
ncbi:MAG: hypothetical protein C4288_10255 [Leptolyngbya sp. ERB_1_1]